MKQSFLYVIINIIFKPCVQTLHNSQQSEADTVPFTSYWGECMINKKGILIVDDSELDQSILVDILQEKYKVFTAANGRDALAVLHEHGDHIAVILLDLYMPVMNGYEFLSVQQADEVIADIPVIVITQQDNNDAEIEALSYGASAYLTKSYDRELILQKIGDEIRKQEVDYLMKTIDLDTLTGCYNREGFCKKAQDLLREEAVYDIIAFDIEQFRVVNDVYGIHEGDRLLQYLARIMTGFVRENGGICGRISGDCFVMLLVRKNRYEEMVGYVDKAMERYPLQIKIVVRFGIYQIEDRTIDVTVMYDRAVLAVKRIKGKYGEAYAYFDDSMRNELLLEKEITNSMQQALADGEFLVYLQPKCNLKTEEYVGAEALIRWMNPERGLLPPGQFIPIFEKTGFITEVDLYVWEQVCKMLARWKQENRMLIPISVNVSRADLYHSDFMDRILELMDKYENYHFVPVNPMERQDYNLFASESGLTLLISNSETPFMLEIRRPELSHACHEYLMRMAELVGYTGIRRTKIRMRIQELIQELRQS